MIRQVKGTEPTTLRRYRATPESTWDGFADKAGVLEHLLRSQRSTCCYCGRRISEASAHVEHFRPQRGPHARPDLQLAWSNLWAVCPGGRGHPPARQHCDTRKGDQLCELDPATVEERLFHYAAGGAIRHADASRNEESERVLGLNVDALTEARRTVLQAWIVAFGRRHHGSWSHDALARERDRLRQMDPAPEHLGTVLYYIEMRLGRGSGK